MNISEFITGGNHLKTAIDHASAANIRHLADIQERLIDSIEIFFQPGALHAASQYIPHVQRIQLSTVSRFSSSPFEDDYPNHGHQQ